MANVLGSDGHDLFQGRGVKRLSKTKINLLLDNGKCIRDLTRYIPSTELVHHSHTNQIGAVILVVDIESLEIQVI